MLILHRQPKLPPLCMETLVRRLGRIFSQNDRLGNRKMDRLEKFYKYGLSQAGWNKYSYINVEFDNQIICKKRQYEKTEELN